ncbi:MAG: hypothetical protein HZB38_14550 [Planctomycetes bacterium]|nr:hypothetical protein [Planctomycetota bacterium]
MAAEAAEFQHDDMLRRVPGPSALRPSVLRILRRTETWAAAAVAAVLVVLMILPGKRASRPDQNRAGIASGVSPIVAVCPMPGETRIAHVAAAPPSAAPASEWMLTLVRSWNPDCDCLLWEIHRWANGSALTGVRPGDSLEVDFNAGHAPAVQQVLVLAFDDDRARLDDAAANDAADLLNCLNSSDVTYGPIADASQYASAVESCLPHGVRVEMHPLTQHSPR